MSMERTIRIAGREISSRQPPFIIAELSGNHNQSLDRALRLIDLAVDAGAHAIKIQSYTADSITIDCDNPEFVINDPKSVWNGKNLYALYQEASTPYSWHEAIFKKCAERGVICFSTPFDETAVDFLEQFNPPVYKIASFENNHFPLIKKVIETGKPIIISLGISSVESIDELELFLKKNDAKDVILLKCTSAYPALPKDANLKTIPFLAERTGRIIGLSDHTMGTAVAVASVALGAQVIEKHFTDSRALGGVDSSFSLEPHELKTLVEETKAAWESVGEATFELGESEQKSRQFKRSIYVTADVKTGQKFTKDNVRVIRPGFGIEPKYYESVLTSVAARDLKRGDALKIDDFKS
jgi:pseudaminic acid synthase